MSSQSQHSALAAETDGVDSQFVRNFLLTGGQVRPRHLLSLETVLEPCRGRPGPELPPECGQILALCQQRRSSVTELAGTIRRPVSTVKILVSYLLDAGALRVPVTSGCTEPADDSPFGRRPSRQLLEALSAGLKTKWPDADTYLQAG